MSSDQIRDEIAQWLDLGWSLDEVQSALIEPAVGLTADERDALWLFAWSYPRGGTRVVDRLHSAIAA